jgi:beta-lactam-binding protein with PASTA domain
VVHRDVKPGNVLITDDGQVKVTDFGIARAINTEESLTQTGAVMGTATYFSPEQAEGLGVDARSDIYSLGVVLFEMVTGRPPFLGESPVAVASKHVRDNPPAPRELNPQIPPTFEAIILKSMAKDPAHRYATAEELRADLLRFNEGRSVLAMEDTTAMIGVAGATTTMTAVAGMDATRAVGAVGPDDGSQAGADGEAPDETGTNRTRNYAIALVLLLLLLGIAGFLLGRNLGYFGGDASFNLPNVVGQTSQVATATLRADGLSVNQVQQISNATSGTVISTNPGADALVKKGDTVTIKVAEIAPPVQVTVPAGLTNTTQANATGILQSAGLQATIVSRTSAAPAGTVLSTNPPSGAKINQGAAVTLTVSSGPANVIVPSLIGLTEAAAGQALGNAQLQVGNVTPVASSQYPAGLVVSSNPGTGASVSPGSKVDIAVSTGSPPTTTTTTTAPPPPTTTTSSTTTTTKPKGP